MQLDIIRTSRRQAAECAVDLRNRRRWYAYADAQDAQGDDKPPAVPEEPATPETDEKPTETDIPSWVADDPAKTHAYITELRKEAAANRKAADELRQQQEKAEKERQVAEQKRLEQQGEWQKIAEQRQQEVEQLTPLKATVEKYETALRSQNEARVQDAPEGVREMLTELHKRMDPIEFAGYLNDNADKLKKAPAPNLNGGQQSTGTKKPPRQQVLGKRRY